MDENQGRIHLHAMRHSTGTHLSAAGVSPRTAQAVMRHSDIALTMNTYTDEKLLQTSAAVELLPELRISDKTSSSVAPTVAPASYKRSQNGSKPGKIGRLERQPPEHEKTPENQRFTGSIVDRDDKIRTCDLCTPSADDDYRNVSPNFIFNPCFTVKNTISVSLERIAECNAKCNIMHLDAVALTSAHRPQVSTVDMSPFVIEPRRGLFVRRFAP